jgi:hypothetical protein
MDFVLGQRFLDCFGELSYQQKTDLARAVSDLFSITSNYCSILLRDHTLSEAQRSPRYTNAITRPTSGEPHSAVTAIPYSIGPLNYIIFLTLDKIVPASSCGLFSNERQFLEACAYRGAPVTRPSDELSRVPYDKVLEIYDMVRPLYPAPAHLYTFHFAHGDLSAVREAFDRQIFATQQKERMFDLIVENFGLSMTQRQAVRPEPRDFERHREESAWHYAKYQALTNRAKHDQELGAQEPHHEEPTALGSLFSEEHSPKQLVKSRCSRPLCHAGPDSCTPLAKDWTMGTLRLQPLQVIGTGTYSKVISAFHITGLSSTPTRRDGRCEVAVKIISIENYETFLQDVQFLKALATDAVVPRLFATVLTKNTQFIIMVSKFNGII